MVKSTTTSAMASSATAVTTPTSLAAATISSAISGAISSTGRTSATSSFSSLSSSPASSPISTIGTSAALEPNSTPSSTSSSNQTSMQSTGGGTKAGIAIAVVVGIVLLALPVFAIMKWRRKHEPQEQSHDQAQVLPDLEKQRQQRPKPLNLKAGPVLGKVYLYENVPSTPTTPTTILGRISEEGEHTSEKYEMAPRSRSVIEVDSNSHYSLFPTPKRTPSTQGR